MFVWLRARKAARRIGLRDKGYTSRSTDVIEGREVLVTMVHIPCRTRLRVGIDNDGNAVKYCWRCEAIISDGDGPDNPAREPKPDEKKPSVKAHSHLRLVS